MKRIVVLTAAVTSMCFASFLEAKAASNLEKCISAAISGPEKKHLKINSHTFHCKPVSVVKRGSSKLVSGQLSHAIKLRPDDQVYYSFQTENGELKLDSLKQNLYEGGASPIFGTAAAALSGRKVDPEDATRLSRKLAMTVTGGGWKETAAQIIEGVAYAYTAQ